MSRADELTMAIVRPMHAWETGERITDGSGAAGGPCTVCTPRAQRVARAICEHLDVSWEDVTPEGGFCSTRSVRKVALAVVTLLEAAAIPRDGETT